MEGKLLGVDIQVLADSGASHYFIAPRVAATLGLNIEQGRTIGVKLGDGHKIAALCECRNLEVQLGKFTTMIDAYVLELGDLDLILGAAWMRRFGKVIFDWKEMTLSFSWKGEIVELQGLNHNKESTGRRKTTPHLVLHSIVY